RSQQSPENGNSRSPLSNTTQDSNVRKNNNVEFREPLATYREASPSPHPSSQLEAYSLPSVPKSSYSSSLPTQNSPFSELVYTRDTRDRQTDMDLDSTHSSALESTNVHYLNDQHAVDSVRPEENTPKAQFSSEGPAFNSCITGSPSTVQRGDSTPSTSPGSASQRLENLRRHQPDNKLEKLKECIRKQRQHLEEAAEKEKLLGFLDRPIKASTESNGFATNERPPAKVRKVAAAPPAPIYKGFNSTETNIRTPDGKVWKREEFHKLNRQIYRELSQHVLLSFPTVITPASWRDGQKLVHMVLGPGPKLSKEEEGPTPTERPSRTGSRSESKNQSRPTSKERTRAAFQGKTKINSFVKTVPSSTAQDTTSESPTTKLLSADIQGILDDLQLDLSQTRTPVSTWATAVAATNSSRVCRSASPMANQSEMTTAIESSNKKRHYDADTVRQYIARQQDERKRRQVQEKKAMREEADRRNQRLQELYRKQREAAKSEVPVHPVQKRLRETYTKLLNETEDIRITECVPQQRPIYQPSGESDKENKRLEAPQSPSSSDRSLNEQLPPPLSRTDLDFGMESLREPAQLSTVVQPVTDLHPPTNEHVLSQILRLERAMAASNIKHTQRPATSPFNKSRSKMSRIEALKATAASLSNRIESEARKLAGEGINYGLPTSMDVDATMAPETCDLNLPDWAEMATRATEGNNDIALRMQRISNCTGQNLYDPMVLPGAGCLSFREQKEKTGAHASLINNPTYENASNFHDSSAGSISEGPLLSEGSISGDERSPVHPCNSYTHGVAGGLEEMNHSSSRKKDHQRLQNFEREAAVCSPFGQRACSKAGWEEMNKGTPLSVINIFTKNFQGHTDGKYILSKSYSSPFDQSMHSGSAAVYEDDFVSSSSSRHLISFFSPAGLQYSPAVLQQRMAAELQYLGSMEDSVRQLGDIERLLAVSVSQQESMSLTQMLKANQERHERDLYELKIKAEREALEMQLQLEENKQRVARAHIEMQENLAATQRDTLEGLQESATKMMTQQAEAARYTADAARHIKEVSNLLKNQPLVICHILLMFPSVFVYKTKIFLLFLSEGTSSSNHSPSSAASDYSKEVLEGKRGGTEGRPMRHAVSSSIEERVAPAANGSLCSDSVPSVLDERSKTCTSIATEYSLKFDESMTEDDIEEHSFRSLLPSEAHRRGTMEKKSRHHYESEEDGANPNTTLIPGSHIFSGGQDSFSQFTMDMVRQYMKDEEVRLQHQSALLRLRQKALKEKTRTELAWLEHQKKNLRDKGEDDKMPPIRKKQRGLLIKLQQEQAEIRRLQEANKAARKERQILLKQQEEIERMRNSTLRLKERLKCAGGEESPVSELAGSEAISSHSKDADNRRSPSPPLSVSGSETSSIMQKLKKMRSHNDEKFLTKREQQLMQRRLHAEELLQWKQRLDKEEAEVRRMEKEALTVWDRRTSQNKDLDMSNKKTKEISYASPQSIQHPSSDEEKSSSVRSDSSIHTEGLPSQQLESPSLAPPSSVPGTPLISILSSPATYTPDFTSVSQSPEIQVCSMNIWLGFYLNLPAETISDQSDIESRIQALKEELRKRKSMAQLLKKEQKKRNKERLKAQEASLLKQLENYNNFIEKTKAELDKETESSSDTKPLIKDPSLIPEPSNGSQDEVIEEEIPEELSDHSATSERTQQSGRLFDLDKQKDELKLDNKSDSPSISPEQTTQSQLIVEMPDFNIGDRVLVGGVQPGTLKFKGPTSFANGFWAGVELDKSEGSNNGTYDGVVYFICKESHGIFAPPDKITHLPDKFELFTDTTEDEDSFFDDLGDKEENKHTNNNDMSGSHRDLNSEDERPSFKTTEFGVKSVDNQSLHRDPPPLKITSYLSSLHQKDSELPVSNGNAEDFILNLKDAAQTVHISDMDKDGLELQSKKVTPPKDRGDFRPREDGRTLADAFTNTLINNFLKDTVATLIEIKKTKKQNIEEANQMNEDFFSQPAEEEEKWIPSVDQKDDLPFFLPAEKVDLLSPELCNRPESPVFGASGQEELAKRLAELELSRELLDDLGDDQDWFDEDFGLSSRREQQRLKKEEARLTMGGTVSSAGVEQQVKIPPRPELPLPLPPKLPEQPAMVVPHSAAEVEKMVFAATQQIWESCDLGKQGAMTLYQMSRPKPSQVYLGEVPSNEDLEALSIHSYRKAVFDLTWEMLEDMYAEDPNSDQPLWIKPRRVKSSAFHRVKAPGDMTRVQEFVAAEVLKLYGLADDQSQKNDWQKMLKFGRKKRDRVDHILVQELHEEEAQWVNYDEDELFVKMQLADSVFDALLKDTVNVLTQISDKRANRDNLT
uniref:CAP-Gly domain-containing protein n=1 Tax=Gouania willdenowi TaxID=441366 RepID=A0A8C5D6V8_GOUWI